MTGLDQILGMGDFNGDGHRDILALDAADTLWLYPSDGILAFGDRVQVATDWAYDLTASVGDMNRDGRPDLLVRSADAALHLLASDGLGAFRAPVQIGTGWDIYNELVGPGDLTGDGKVDVIARGTDGKLWLYRGTGTGTVSSARAARHRVEHLRHSRRPRRLQRRQEGRPARPDSGRCAVPLQGQRRRQGFEQGPGRLRLERDGHLSGVGPGPGSKVVVQSGVGDLNSDGRRDVLARETSTGNDVALSRQGRQAPGTAGSWSRPTGPTCDSPRASATSTVTAVPDLLVVTTDGTVSRYPSNGAGGYGTPVALATGWGIYDQVVSAGDFNGDLRPDVLARDGAGVLWLLAGTGSGFAAPVQVGSAGRRYRIISVGDWDGDRAGDVMAVDSAGALWLYPGDGDSGWFTRVKIGNGWTTIDAVRSWRLHRGRRVDLFARDATGKLWLYPGNGSGGFSTRVQLGNGLGASSTCWSERPLT